MYAQEVAIGAVTDSPAVEKADQTSRGGTRAHKLTVHRTVREMSARAPLTTRPGVFSQPFTLRIKPT